MKLHLDFESRSEIDLRRVGVHRYAMHPSTVVLCASYSFDGITILRWRPWWGEAMPRDLHAALENPICETHCWNADFERLILKHVLEFDIDPRRFRCTMARARSMALPGKLENCALALRIGSQKLDNSIMLKWCKPLPEGGWADDPAEYEKLCDYCDVDVKAEAELGSIVRAFSPEEVEDWAINSEINDRGLAVDRALAAAAQEYAAHEVEDICTELAAVTGGAVTTPRQFARIKDWLFPRLPEELRPVADAAGKVSFDRRAREAILEEVDDYDVDGPTIRAIELIDDAGRASTAKFKAMVDRADPVDSRVRGSYQLNGAGQTNRYSSNGVQTQNMIRAKLPDAERVIEGILRGCTKAELIALAQDGDAPPMNVLTILSRCLRPAIVASEGNKLVWGDWSAIEARVNPWLSNEPAAGPLLARFERDEDVYIHQAMATFNCRRDQVDGHRRQTGKVQILSFGFGGGVGAMMAMARGYGLSMDPGTADFLKHAWRTSNPWAPRFWAAIEGAAMSAMLNPGIACTAGRAQYLFTQGALWVVLPSRRVLCYPLAKVEIVDGRFGPQETIMAMKASRSPKRGASYWPRMKLWGGFLCENIVQAEAASLLRSTLRTLRQNARDDGRPFDVVGHSHDEIILDVPEPEADAALDELTDAMTTRPAWAAELPLNMAGGSGYSYNKD